MPLDFTRKPQKKRRMGVTKIVFATLVIVLVAGLLPPALLAADWTMREAARAPLERLQPW